MRLLLQEEDTPFSREMQSERFPDGAVCADGAAVPAHGKK